MMETETTERPRIQGATKILDLSARLVLVCLQFTILVGMLLAILHTFWDLRLLLTEDLSLGIKRVVIRALAILALVEVYRTGYVYLKEGRVKVTYIVDAALVVLITEILSLWFAATDYLRMSAAVLLLLALALVRVLAIRYSPARSE